MGGEGTTSADLGEAAMAGGRGGGGGTRDTFVCGTGDGCCSNALCPALASYSPRAPRPGRPGQARLARHTSERASKSAGRSGHEELMRQIRRHTGTFRDARLNRFQQEGPEGGRQRPHQGSLLDFPFTTNGKNLKTRPRTRHRMHRDSGTRGRGGAFNPG